MRILFVTGYVGEAGDAGDLAGHEVLRKPFTVNALADAVSAALSRPAQRIAPRRQRRGSRVSAPRIGQRRCQGFTSILVPAWRLIFQAR